MVAGGHISSPWSFGASGPCLIPSAVLTTVLQTLGHVRLCGADRLTLHHVAWGRMGEACQASTSFYQGVGRGSVGRNLHTVMHLDYVLEAPGRRTEQGYWATSPAETEGLRCARSGPQTAHALVGVISSPEGLPPAPGPQVSADSTSPAVGGALGICSPS